jgi:hypothetical protein
MTWLQPKYKIIAKVRNNSKLSSQKIIEELPKRVPLGNPVSLKAPELVILVIVFKVRKNAFFICT